MGMRKIKPAKMEHGAVEASMPSEVYPTFYIGIEHLPEAKDWKVGKTYEITLKVKQTGMSQRKSRDGKEHGSVDFDILAVEAHGPAKGGPINRYVDED